MTYPKDQFGGAGGGVSSDSASVMITARLAPYAASNSVSSMIAAQLSPYITAADVAATYLTSNSASAMITTRLAPYMTSASAATAYVTSNSVSVMIAAAAPPSPGSVLLGYKTLSNINEIAFSGSWSDYAVLQMYAQYRIESGTSATASVGVYTDGGTTPFLSLGTSSATASTNQIIALDLKVFGGDGRPIKSLRSDTTKQTNLFNTAITATANTGFVNAIKWRVSATITAGMAVLFGWRKS